VIASARAHRAGRREARSPTPATLEPWAQLSHTRTEPCGQDEEQIKRHLVHCLEMHDGDRSSAGHLARCAPRNAAAGPALGSRRRARTFAYPDPACQVEDRQPLMHCYIQFVRIRENRIAIHMKATSRGIQDMHDP
jgi:hypothetical protein